MTTVPSKQPPRERGLWTKSSILGLKKQEVTHEQEKEAKRQLVGKSGRKPFPKGSIQFAQAGFDIGR